MPKFDLKSVELPKIDLAKVELPEAAQKPVYATVGAGDLAYITIKEYVVEAQKKAQQKLTAYQKDAQSKVADVQKQVTDFDAKSLRSSIEGRVAELQNDAKAYPAKVREAVTKTVEENTKTVTGTYADLAKRGEAIVKGKPGPAPAAKKAPAKAAPAAKKSPAKKAAKKATAKKTTSKKATTKA